MSVILAFTVAFETAFRQHGVHETISSLTNRFLFVTRIRTLGFGNRRYGRLFLATAGLLVKIPTLIRLVSHIMVPMYMN